ncbi:MAG: hypothetical protein AAFP88_03290 [Bacteroidota bacterium]
MKAKDTGEVSSGRIAFIYLTSTLNGTATLPYGKRFMLVHLLPKPHKNEEMSIKKATRELLSRAGQNILIQLFTRLIFKLLFE